MARETAEKLKEDKALLKLIVQELERSISELTNTTRDLIKDAEDL